MNLHLLRVPQGFVPASQDDAELIDSVRVGDVIHAKFKRMRNPRFHRKFFALLSVGFDHWEPPAQDYAGLPVQKNREFFRKEAIKAAGYVEPAHDLRGNLLLYAKSISFGSMGEDEFQQLYSDVGNVLLQNVLTNYTADDLDQVVERTLAFL